MRKRRNFLVAIFMLLIFSAVNLQSITAVESQEYTTTLTDSDGLEIDIATIKSGEVTDYEEYIKNNLNSDYVNYEKIEAVDAIYVKNLVADRSLMEEYTIDALWNEYCDAYVIDSSLPLLMYNVDDDSDYYVAFVNTMINDTESTVYDYSFAYTNLDGEVITDAIYDYETGIAYIPKYYTQENKNGYGILNVQIELLQLVDTQNPNTTFQVKMNVDEELAGNFATSGTASVEQLATKFGIRVALDDVAVSTLSSVYPEDGYLKIDQLFFKVYVNGLETNDYDYYEEAGIIVINQMPTNIESVEISISEENVDDGYEYINSQVSLMSYSYDEIGYLTDDVWIVDEIPAEGTSFYIESDSSQGSSAIFTDTYCAWYDAFTDNGGDYSTYQLSAPSGGSDGDWSALCAAIYNDSSVNLDNLVHAASYLQHLIRFYGDVTSNGITIPAGQTIWLKCVHNATTFEAYTARVDGYFTAWKLKIKIYKVTDEYMIVGVLAPTLTTQAGSGIFKIRYRGSSGNLQVIKQDQYGKRVEGAQYLINGQTYTTDSNGELNVEGLTPGTYTVEETYVPAPLVLDSSVKTIEVTSGNTSTVTFTNTYQRGSVRLTKYDADNRGATLGDATLEGAVYSLYAKNDIYEGSTLIYSAGQLVKSGITTASDGTTEAVTDLPVGTYYYKETQASSGFKTSSQEIEVTISYAGQNASVAAEAYNEAAEEPVYVNVEINKKLSETDYDAEINLAGVQFKLTSVNHPDQVYYTNVSGSDGKCTVEKIPYGLYTATEVQWPDESLPVDDFDVDLRVTEDKAGQTFTYTKIDKSKTIQVEIYKSLVEEALGKTDALISGAVFTIYTDEKCTTPYVDKNGNNVTLEIKDIKEYTTAGYQALGYAISGKMRTNIYYLKETVFPTGINPDATIPGDTVTYREKVYQFGSLAKDQTEENVVYSIGTKSDPIRNMPYLGRVSVIKYDENYKGSDESPAEGAILRLTLDSSVGTDAEVYYDVTIDSNGYGNFWNDDFSEYDPNTIPYGEYTITEVKTSTNGQSYFYHIQDEAISITYQGDDEKRIVSDEPVPAYLKIVKYDSDTGQIVKMAGASFKIWSIDEDDWVTFQTQYQEITELHITTDDGYLMTPQQLQPGRYVVYETAAPTGYYWEESLRIPTDENGNILEEYLGNADYGGVEVEIDKVATGLSDDAQYPKDGDTSNLVVEVKMYDEESKVKLEVYKTGEKLTTVTTSGTLYGTKYTPVWEERGLEGVEYDVYAVDDVKSPDGTVTHYTAGEKVDHIITGSDGYGETEELYPGTYRLVEVVTPDGYLRDDNIPDLTLTNDNPLERVKLYNKDLNDIRQKLELSFLKKFDEVLYSSTQEVEQTAVFGVYTNEDIYNYVGNKVINKGCLVDVIEVSGESYVTSTIDLPEGSYYVEELEVSNPYTVSKETREFTLEYTSDKTQEFVVALGEELINSPTDAPLMILKLSSSNSYEEDVLSLRGETLTEESILDLDNLSQDLYNTVKDLTIEETLLYLDQLQTDIADNDKNKIITVAGVTYQVFTDEECKKPLYKKNEETGEYTDLVTVTTELTGAAIIYDIPYGTYYIKEVNAPSIYTISDDVVRIDINDTTGIPKVFQITYDDPYGKYIYKTDIFTGDVVPDCIFEITDEEENILVHSITDSEGYAKIPVDIFEDGATYYYTEIDAPDEYNIDTTPHEFVAQIEDNSWIAEPIAVTNTRKTGTVQIIKSDADTGERLEGCVFTIVLLDDEGNEYVNAAGQTIYLVQDAVTDENGEYLIEDVPYGTYKFVEMVAPEGYELDEDMTGLTFTVSDEATYIVFEVTNTGDIAVIALFAAALLSVAGIVITVVKKKIVC